MRTLITAGYPPKDVVVAPRPLTSFIRSALNSPLNHHHVYISLLQFQYSHKQGVIQSDGSSSVLRGTLRSVLHAARLAGDRDMTICWPGMAPRSRCSGAVQLGAGT